MKTLKLIAAIIAVAVLASVIAFVVTVSVFVAPVWERIG